MPVRFEWAYRLRGVLMAPPYLFLSVAYLSSPPETQPYLLAGLVIFAVGIAIRVWAQMHLHYRLSVRKTLTRTGPYRFVRNPIYIGNTLMLLGLTLVAHMLWFLPIMLLWCAVVYTLVVRREEAHLQDKYGAPYLRFLQEVPRWIPKLSPIPEAASGTWVYFWPSVRAELHCLLWLLPFAAGLLTQGY